MPVDAEILDWERATEVVRTAETVAVSLCPCRTDAGLRGEGCGAPVRTCLTLGTAVETLTRSGIAETITNGEAMVILAEAKAAGLAQTGQRPTTFLSLQLLRLLLGMMRSIKRYAIYDGIVPSNWLATIDHEVCRGCAKCAKACPAGAIEIEPTNGKGLRQNWAVIDADRCLGCGVCGEVCRWEAHDMELRDEPPHIPANTMERVALMAIERGKLGDLLVDNVGNRLGQIAASALRVIERMPPWKAAMANQKFRSTFVATLVGQVKGRIPADG